MDLEGVSYTNASFQGLGYTGILLRSRSFGSNYFLGEDLNNMPGHYMLSARFVSSNFGHLSCQLSTISFAFALTGQTFNLTEDGSFSPQSFQISHSSSSDMILINFEGDTEPACDSIIFRDLTIILYRCG